MNNNNQIINQIQYLDQVNKKIDNISKSGDQRNYYYFINKEVLDDYIELQKISAVDKVLGPEYEKSNKTLLGRLHKPISFLRSNLFNLVLTIFSILVTLVITYLTTKFLHNFLSLRKKAKSIVDDLNKGTPYERLAKIEKFRKAYKVYKYIISNAKKIEESAVNYTTIYSDPMLLKSFQKIKRNYHLIITNLFNFFKKYQNLLSPSLRAQLTVIESIIKLG